MIRIPWSTLGKLYAPSSFKVTTADSFSRLCCCSQAPSCPLRWGTCGLRMMRSVQTSGLGGRPQSSWHNGRPHVHRIGSTMRHDAPQVSFVFSQHKPKEQARLAGSLRDLQHSGGSWRVPVFPVSKAHGLNKVSNPCSFRKLGGVSAIFPHKQLKNSG